MLFLKKGGSTLQALTLPKAIKSCLNTGVRLYLCRLLLLCAYAFDLLAQPLKTEDKPENLLGVNSYQDDYAPQISPDGHYLIFQSDRPGFLESHNLWISTNLNYKEPLGPADWSEPRPLQLPFQANDPAASELFSINTNNFEGSPAVLYRNAMAVELYFTSLRSQSSRRDGFSGLNIYQARLHDQKWQEPEHLNRVNSEFDDRMPSLPHDASQLVFSSNRPGGYGGYDLWFSQRNLKTNKWSIPLNAGSIINTVFNETAPSLSPDGKLLFFSSDRNGGLGHYDLYISRSQQGKWSLSKNLGRPFNSEWDDECFITSHDGLWAYFASDRQEGRKKEGFDVYRIRLPLWLYTAVDVLFTGQVLDGSSKVILGVEATIHILSEKEKRIITSRAFRAANAQSVNSFKTYLKSGRLYRVQVSAPGFIPQELSLDYRSNLPRGKTDRHIITLQKIKPVQKPGKGAPCLDDEAACLDRLYVYFEVDRSDIRPSELSKIEAAAQIMKKNPALKVRLEGHTDSTSTESYNQRLSERRADAVRQLLLKEGIEKDRLSIRGYGFLKPAVPEKSAQDRSLNRRVEFFRVP